MQKEILAMKENRRIVRIVLKKDWLMPRIEGSTVRMRPKMKIGFERV